MRVHKSWVFLWCVCLWAGILGGKSFGQQPNIDSLQTALQQAGELEDRLPILIDLANHYNRSDLKKALGFAQEAVRLTEQEKGTTSRAKALLVLGRTYANIGDLDSALYHFQIAKTDFELAQDSLGLADAHSKLQYAHLYLGNTDSALYHALQGLRLFEANDNQKGISISLSKAAESLYSQGKFEEAVDYALRAVAVAEEINDSISIGDGLSTVASNYLMLEKYDQALEYQNRAVELFERMNSDLDVAINLNSRGNVYKLSGNLELALKDYEDGLAMSEPLGYGGLIRAIRSNIGDVKIRTGKYREGLPYMIETLKMQQDQGHRRDKPETYLHLATAYAGLGQHDSAYHYRILFDELKDSLYTEDSDQRMLDIRAKYETEKMEAANRLLEQQKQQQGLLLWTALVGLIAIGLIAFLLYRNNQRRKKTNHLLNQQKSEIERKNQQNETLLKEIHHRVKNNLQVISSLLRLQTSDIEDEAVRELVAAGEHRVKSMALIHQKLYQRDNLSGIEMKNYLTTLGKSLIDTLNSMDKEIELTVEMEELEVDVDTAVPLGLIANELITNSLKYAFHERASGHIRVSLTLNEAGLLELMVADDGIGQGGDSTLITGTSFGSRLVQLLCIQMDGEVQIETERGRSTRVAVREFEILS